jgi:hypothetical protein
LFFIAREAAGASSARHSLRPLIYPGQSLEQNSRGLRGEIAGVYPRAALLFEN